MTFVTTVLGQVPSNKLGRTLMHEHLVADFSARCSPREEASILGYDGLVTADDAWLLRENPFGCLDNCRLNDSRAVAQEVKHFVDAGGRTIIDATCEGIGRNPEMLVEISLQTGINIVMGSGWYLEDTHPDYVSTCSVDQLAERLVKDFEQGPGGNGICSGLIGEIGISADFTANEERCLRAAARAQRIVHAPLMVHLPGWDQHGDAVLDILAEEGVTPRAVVLCHMNPAGGDLDYLVGLAGRGAWLEFDMIGMGLYFPAHGGQSPSPDSDAICILELVNAGFGRQILLSHDVFLKSMWTQNGGNGLAYIPRLFLGRLVRNGVPQALAASMIDDTPREVFEAASAAGYTAER